ncbi:hypothetical protein Bca52824_061425 [Brassica carinata]|uniref:F-box domain-containing protein n=1 Tax=Brassica carinata TaxID=52824 RepID=A0A8X7QYG4_BRACI|nr:hypothetical protein Bca52824_061425 [Brassica carinata]
MASSSSYSPPLSTSMSQMKPEQPRNWAELPPELISSILLRLNSIEILETAQKVCRSWRRVCKDPSMWRKIDMDNDGDLGSMGDYSEYDYDDYDNDYDPFKKSL